MTNLPKPYFNKNRLIPAFFLIIAFISVVYGVYCYASSHANMLGFLYGADSIQIPFFAHNILYQHGSIFDWSLPFTPYFFPDMLLVMLVSLFSKNIEIVSASYAILQMGLYVFIIGFLCKVTTQDRGAVRLGIIAALVSLAALAKGHLQNELLNSILNSNFHMGCTLIVFAVTALLLCVVENAKGKRILILCGLIIIMYLSDILFVLYFIGPALAMLTILCLLRFVPLKRYIKLFSAIVLTTLASSVLYNNLPHFVAKSGKHLFRFHHLIYYLHQLKFVLMALFHNDPVVFVLWVGYFALAPLLLMHRFFKASRRPPAVLSEALDSRMTWVLLFEWLTIVAGLVGLVLSDPGLSSAPQYTGLRHAQPLILGPVLIGWPLLLYRYTKIGRVMGNNWAYCGVLTLLVMAVFIHKPALNKKSLFQFYPPVLACMDQHVRDLHLHSGIGDYAQAKPFTAFNKTGFYLVAVGDDPHVGNKIIPYHWINTLQPYRTQTFDFAVVKSPTRQLNLRLLHQNLGKPTSTFNCGRDYRVEVYKNNGMKDLFSSYRHGSQ